MVKRKEEKRMYSSKKHVGKVETQVGGAGLSVEKQTETAVNKKTEEQLINSFLERQYRTCYVHLVNCEMDVQARNCRKNDFNLSNFRIEVNSNNKRIVHHVAQNKKVKFNVKCREDVSLTKEERNYSIEEDTLKNSPNSSLKGVLETSVSKKTQIRIRRPSYSRQSNNNSNSNDNNDSGQLISRNTVLDEERWKSSVSNNSKYSRKRSKSLSTTDVEEHNGNKYSDKFNIKKPCFTKNVSVKKKNLTRNSLCENARGIYRSEKKQEESLKERISTKIEPSSLNIITSQNKLSPVNYSGVQQNDNGKYILIKTPAEKKMYEEKLYDLELAMVGKCDPKQVTENYVGESKSGTEDQACSVMRVDKNNKQKKIVKGSTALFNNVKTKRKLGNTENVVESKLPVVSEDRLSRCDQQGDCISRKKINTIQKGTVKIPTNSVAKQLSKKSILKHNEGDDNNNEDKNVCITKHERKNSREDTAETTSSFCTRNLSSSETLDSSDQVISDKVEHCSKSSGGDDQDEHHRNRNALESQNVSINGEQDQHRNISDESKRVNSDNEEQSTKHVTITGEQDQHMSSDEQDEGSSSDDEEHSFKRITVSSEHDHHDAEQDQCMSIELDESSSSNEEGRSVSDFEQIHRTSIIIQKRTSDSDVDDDDNEDSDNRQIRYINSVKQNKAISDDDYYVKEIHRNITVKHKRVVSDSDDDDDKHIHRASSVKQNDDSDKQLHSVSDKNRNQSVNNDGQSHRGKQSTLKNDDDDGKQIQCMSGEKQSQNLSDDDYEGEGISGDQSVNYGKINQHIRKLCFNNSSSFSDIKSEKTIKKHSPEKMPPPAPPPLLRNRSVRNDKKNCKEIMRRFPSDCSSEKSSAPCVNSIPAAVHNGDDNGDDSDDNCSDVLSLFADTETMDFVTTCALERSVPNPFLHTTAAPKKNAFGARGNHCSGMSTITDTVTNSVVRDSITDFVTICALTRSVPNPYLHTTAAPKKNAFGARGNHCSGMSTITDTVTNSVVSDSITENCDKILQSSEKNYDAYNFPKKTVSASNSHSSISEDSSEIKSTNTAVKLNFRIPKIVKTSKTESDEDNSVSEKNDRQHNDVLKRDTVLSKRYPGPSVGKDVEYDGRITKTNVKTSSPERAKDSQVLEKNVKYGPNGLLRRECVFTKRSPEPSAGKETEYGRTPKINVNTCSTESITVRGKVSPVVEKNDKCKSNEFLTREVVSTKRGLEPSSVKETESDRIPKFDVKTGNTSRGKVSPVSEKRDKSRQNDSLTREIVLTSKRSQITFERKETEQRKLVEEVSQECKIIKLGSSLPLTEKKMGGDSENNRRKIVLKDSPELKISKEGLESSAGKEQDCGTVQRKTVGRDSAVPEKKLRIDDSLKLLTRYQTYGKSLETATSGNKERTERPAAGTPKHLAEAFKLVRKGAFNTAVAVNKDSQSQVGASSAEPMGTTPRRHMKIKTINERSLPTDHMNSEEYEKSVRLNTLFAGCCMTYLRTSKCDPPCSLSHKVGALLIVKSSNNSGDDMQLKSLEEFVSEAPKPPLSMIDSVCTTFVVHGRADAIFSVNKIFTKRCAYSDSEYMRNLLKILIHALRQCYGDTESSLAAIVKYLCKDVELNESKQEILDKVVTTIEETVKVDHRWDIFSGLASVKDYVWSQALLDSVLDDFTLKHQRYLLESRNLNAVRDYASVLLRASQEENLFNIWKRFQAKLSKLFSFIKVHHMSVKTLRAKINWFEYVDRTVGHYMPEAQFRHVYGEGDTKETELSSTNNLVTASEDVEKHSRISGMSRAESRNVTGVHNRLLSGDKGTVNIPKFNNRSVDSVENVAGPVDQKWSDNMMKFNHPWTVTSVSGSHNSEFSDVYTGSSGFERRHSAGDSGVCSNDNKRLSRNEHFLVPQPCDFNITENETYLQKLENQSRNTPSSSHYNLVDDSLDNREENSVNMFTRQREKRECPVLENKTVVHMNGQYQLRGMSGGSVFQNANSNSSSKANLFVVHNNDDDETDHRKFASYNSNNIERNMQSSNNRNYYPRPSGYRERLNQFNEDRHSAAVHDAQHLQQQSSAKSESPSEANKTCIIQYPLEITEPCSSKSSNNFNSYDSFLSNGNAEQHVHDRKPFLPTDCRRLKRSRSVTSLPANVQKSESTGSTTRLTTKDDSCLLHVGDTGHLPNNGGRCYSLQEHENDCSKVYLPSKCTKNMASSTNHVEQVRKRFSASFNDEYSEKNQRTTNLYNGRAQNTRPKHPGGESHGIGSVVNMRTESDDIPSTSSGLNSGRTSVPPSMELSANLPCETFHQNESNTDRFNEGPMSNSGRQSTVRLQSGYSALPNHDSSTSVTVGRRTSKLKLAELDEDANYAKQFLEVNDYHHVLNLFDKWQNTEQISDLTKYVFVTLADVKGKTGYDKCYNTFRGLLSTAINSGKLSTVMRKSLASIALNLVLDMVISESWFCAHEIVNLILDHDLPFSSCKVYRDNQYSAAGRNLIFAEVCMRSGELEKAVILLNKHSMLAVDRKEWSLRSVNRDMTIRNHLIKTLLDSTITSDNLDLAYSFLINLMEAQRDITQPINLVKSYELLLSKLLDQTDTCMGLQLFKEIHSYHDVPVVVDVILCRALVVACFNESEIELAKQLVKRGYFIGAYTRNTHMFTVKINSVWTRAEMNILIEEALNTVFNSLKKRSTISTAAIDCDLHFAVVKGGYQNTSLPKLLTGVDSSLTGATYRLKSVLSTGFYPSLYENSQESDSPYVVVKKSVMVNYFSYHLQNAPRS